MTEIQVTEIQVTEIQPEENADQPPTQTDEATDHSIRYHLREVALRMFPEYQTKYTIYTIQSSVEGLRTSVTKVGDDVTKIGDDVTKLGGDVAAVLTTTQPLPEQMSAVSTEIQGVKEQVGELKAIAQTLADRLTPPDNMTAPSLYATLLQQHEAVIQKIEGALPNRSPVELPASADLANLLTYLREEREKFTTDRLLYKNGLTKVLQASFSVLEAIYTRYTHLEDGECKNDLDRFMKRFQRDMQTAGVRVILPKPGVPYDSTDHYAEETISDDHADYVIERTKRPGYNCPEYGIYQKAVVVLREATAESQTD